MGHSKPSSSSVAVARGAKFSARGVNVPVMTTEDNFLLVEVSRLSTRRPAVLSEFPIKLNGI